MIEEASEAAREGAPVGGGRGDAVPLGPRRRLPHIGSSARRGRSFGSPRAMVNTLLIVGAVPLGLLHASKLDPDLGVPGADHTHAPLDMNWRALLERLGKTLC